MNSLSRFFLGKQTSQSAGTPGIHDFSGLNITDIYSVLKSNLATIDYFCKIIKSDLTGSEYYVFYENNDEVTMNSKVSTSLVPSATTLGDLTAGSTWNVVSFYGQITGHEMVQSGNAIATLVQNGVLNTKNGKASIQFKNVQDGCYEGFKVSTIDSNVNHSISSVFASDASETVGVILTTSNTSTYRLQLYMDKRVGKLISFIKDLVGTTISSNYLAQQDNNNQKRLVVTVDPQVEFKSYYNSVLQDTDAFTSTYTNDILRVGAGTSRTTAFSNGHFQFLSFSDNTLNQTQVNDLDTKLNNFFTF